VVDDNWVNSITLDNGDEWKSRIYYVIRARSVVDFDDKYVNRRSLSCVDNKYDRFD